ncbi:uncharacterized protein LOC143894261 isoform X2 [Temnothorax americanus]|uniref:uncharacterized protein LOC143894261 isoform X2 n=1 Tax=Temnothorax americanus TaxID=1964332 RepID=UPI0040687511
MLSIVPIPLLKPVWLCGTILFPSISSLILSARIAVYTLYKEGIIVTPLYSSALFPSPFFTIGVIIPSFQISGHPPPFHILLINFHAQTSNPFPPRFQASPGISSFPIAFPSFSFFITLLISSILISSSSSPSFSSLSPSFPILTLPSTPPNNLIKCSFHSSSSIPSSIPLLFFLSLFTISHTSASLLAPSTFLSHLWFSSSFFLLHIFLNFFLLSLYALASPLFFLQSFNFLLVSFFASRHFSSHHPTFPFLFPSSSSTPFIASVILVSISSHSLFNSSSFSSTSPIFSLNLFAPSSFHTPLLLFFHPPLLSFSSFPLLTTISNG